MTSVSRYSRRTLITTAGIAVTALALTACTGGDSEGADDTTIGGALTIGTTDKITTIDPAGSYDNGSFAVMNQVYPFLLNTPYGSPDVEPHIAVSAEFTASDVKFTADRQIAIADPNGPSSLLYNLESTEAVDDTTVVFHLKSENDQVFPQILSSPAGPIID